jgi:exonuclease III
VLSPKATDRSTKNENIKIITQNVQGLRSEEKLEYIIRLMKHHKIQAFLIQETHLAEDYISQITDDFLLIHHGPKKRTNIWNQRRSGNNIIKRMERAMEKRRMHH